ncbi:MAG: hypothetical protein M8866_06850 [marine benthic group bacterium]|nr:hypothetical protein [Candidatus Benthicola marisminoris]
MTRFAQRKTRSRGRRAAVVLLVFFTAGLGSGALSSASAQSTEGSGEAAVAGAALGLYSGTALGTLSSIIPCNQTLAGIRCVRTVATLGAGIGTMSGLALGLDDADAVWRAYGRAGIGLAAGSVFVLALKPFVDKWSWGDVGAGAVVGSSIAAGGSGAWVGLLVGTGVGMALWQAVPSFDLPNAVGLGLIGMAVGGFTSWVVRAVESGGEPDSDLPVLQFDLGVPW